MSRLEEVKRGDLDGLVRDSVHETTTDVRLLLANIDAAIAAARIEGLKEAARAVCQDCANNVVLSGTRHIYDTGGDWGCMAVDILKIIADAESKLGATSTEVTVGHNEQEAPKGPIEVAKMTDALEDMIVEIEKRTLCSVVFTRFNDGRWRCLSNTANVANVATEDSASAAASALLAKLRAEKKSS